MDNKKITDTDKVLRTYIDILDRYSKTGILTRENIENYIIDIYGLGIINGKIIQLKENIENEN